MFATKRPNLNDPAREGARLQPERDGRVRSGWLDGVALICSSPELDALTQSAPVEIQLPM
jgi:hypothetical protein